MLPCRPGERKHKSDTEGRWAHDKFAALELGQDIDNTSESAFVRIMPVACMHSMGGAGSLLLTSGGLGRSLWTRPRTA